MIIAQITDTHIKSDGRLAYRKVDTMACLKACVDHLNALAPAPDVVVMSGDMTDFGTADEYTIARSLLDRLAMPYFVVPGNHDARDAMRTAFSDHSYLPADGFLHYAVEDYPVRLIGLDSTLPGQPYGEMCDARLTWLGETLDEETRKPTLLFMHHPPFLTGVAHMDRQNCRNAKAMGALIERHTQVQMILCGHVHRPAQTLWHGTLACIGPSPSHAVALDLSPDGPPAFIQEPPACRIVHLTEDKRLVADLTYIGSFDGPHPFFNADGSLID
ncbi:phosphodiesterase [Pelagibius sp. Alg239-R121]|uniref:phosphodiesterase n=1 Tax=Pelagibius sp. Alg239-R121 TaxID=2993448 RepID=UPI0024A762AF|nr:phosphodiesterase [Pelagibius sp. Alg239-R121]